MNVLKIQKRLFPVFFFICIAFPENAFAAEFYSINSLFGISMRETNSVCKDKNGFIWTSSKTGVLRLTEDDYRIYHLPYESANIISVELVYKDPELLAFTNNGQVFSYNPVYDRFDLFLNLGKILDNSCLYVYSLLADDSGTLWIATNSGLFEYQSGKLLLVGEMSAEKYATAWFDKQHLVVVKTDGIWLFDVHSHEFRKIFENRREKSFTVSSLFLDKNRNILWIGTMSNGLLCYNFTSDTLSRFLRSAFPRQPVLAMEANSDSTLLVGVDGQGIWELNRKEKQVLHVYKESADDPSSLKGNGVYDLFCDEHKRVWVCTYSGGLSFFDQAASFVDQIVHRINDVNSLANNDVNGVIEDRWGKMWFATNNGISCWDASSNRWKRFYQNKQEQAQVFLSLCEDDKGRIWAGSYSSGVYVLDGRTGKELAHYSQDRAGSPVCSDFIMNIYKDSRGDIWLGGVNGEFICYLSEEKKFRTYSKEPVNAFAELSENQILLGCSYGLVLLDKQTGECKRLLPGILVRDILMLGDEVWIGTSGDGLVRYKYKSGEKKQYTGVSGLPSNFINSIVYADSCLWLGTENGICRFNPQDNSVFNYSSVFPLSRTSFNYGACFKLKNGKLAWGTNHGALIFEPEMLREIPSEGRIFFQDIAVAGRSVREIPSFRLDTPVDCFKTINLKYFQNTINLELLPLGTSSGAKFSWRMEGFDQEWTPPSGNRIITYTNIPSGVYTLRIKLLDCSLEKIISERSVSIRLVPPFWRTAWFWMLLLVALAGIVVLYLLLYINNLKQKHTEEKIRFFTNTAHDIRTSLTLIKAPVEELNKEPELSEAGKHYLRLATEQARQLSAVVTQLMDFQKVDVGKEKISLAMVDVVRLIESRRLMFESFASGRNIKLVFVSDRCRYMTAVDETKMEKIIDNLISNAVKYSHPDSQVRIYLKCGDKKWVLQVKDQGIGISRKAQRRLFKEFYRAKNAINSKVVGSGIGLLLVKNYVALHKGTISCISQKNAGSMFQVVVPFKTETKALRSSEYRASQVCAADVLLQGVSGGKTHPSSAMKVLIVEDNNDLLSFICSTLHNEFEVHTAVDGIKAWEFVTGHMPDLVVSDIMMPYMDGFELCRLMKSTYETSHIPVILLTALSGKAEQLRGLGLGADDYLTKPFDMCILIERIKSVVRNRKAVREKALKLIKSSPDEPVLENKLNDMFVKKMLEVVNANISNSCFGKEEFASAMNVSSSLLYKKVKLLTDLSPTGFIKTLRLNRALELLQTRKYTVTEVSELCGFGSLGYFSTVFRKHFGKSPTGI